VAGARKGDGAEAISWPRPFVEEDLLLYLEARLWADAEDRWAEALADGEWRGLALEGLVGAVVRVLLEAYRVGAQQRRVLEARRGEPDADAPARRFHARLRTDLRELLLAHRARIEHDDPERAVELALSVLVGAIREFEESPELARALPELDDELRVDALTRVVLAYLGAPPGAGGGEAVEFFEIWQ
jgi:hypothetical protein